MRRNNNAYRPVHAREFFDRGHIFDVAHAGAAQFVRKDHAHQSEFAEFSERRQREFCGFISLAHVGRDLALRKHTDAFLELQLLVVELEVHDASSIPR